MSDEKSKPILREISVSVSTGGKVQVVKYELSADYHYSVGGKWSIPEDWTDSEAEDFRQYQIKKLSDELEEPAQRVLDDLYRQRDENL